MVCLSGGVRGLNAGGAQVWIVDLVFQLDPGACLVSTYRTSGAWSRINMLGVSDSRAGSLVWVVNSLNLGKRMTCVAMLASNVSESERRHE